MFWFVFAFAFIVAYFLSQKMYKLPIMNMKTYIPKFSDKKYVDYTPEYSKPKDKMTFEDFIRHTQKENQNTMFPEDYGDIIFDQGQ